MEVEQAIKIIKQQGIMKTKPKTKKQAEIREALQTLVEAGEKQIPKKPIISKNLMTKHVSAHCSICGTDITYYSSEEHYCHSCGQALKWE